MEVNKLICSDEELKNWLHVVHIYGGLSRSYPWYYYKRSIRGDGIEIQGKSIALTTCLTVLAVVKSTSD